MATIDLTTDSFEVTIKDNAIVLIEVFAPWCGHCRQFTPTFKAESEKYPDIVFAMVNVDEEPELVKSLGIRGVPTVLGYKKGIQVHSNSGIMTGAMLATFIKTVREHGTGDISDVNK